MSYQDKIDLITAQAWHYYMIGHKKQSIDKIKEGLSFSANNPELHFLQALCYYELGTYHEAEKSCRQAFEYNYPPCDCYYLLGKIAIETGEYSSAEDMFLNTLELESERADVLGAYGFLMLKTGYDKKAKKLIHKALEIDPEDTTANHVRFIYFLKKDQKNEIKTSLNQFIQTSENEVHKLYHIGVMEWNAKRYGAAREVFRQAFLLEPTNGDLLEALQIVDQAASPVFLPHRIVEKLGGPIIVWIGMMVLLYLFLAYELAVAAGVLSVSYIVLCVYLWISPLVYEKAFKN